MDEMFQAAATSLIACYAATHESDAADRFTEFHDQIRGWVQGQAWFGLGRWFPRNRNERSLDVTQGMFIQVWKTWQKPDTRWRADKGSLRGWLSVLVDHTITDLYRSERRFGAELFSQVPSTGAWKPETTLPARNPTPADDVALADLLDSFLRNLSEDDRRLLDMKRSENLTQGEIADRLGLSDAVVSRRLADMRKQLVALFEMHGTGVE